MASKTTHIAVTSIPCFSHQASIIEFCKRLIHLHPHFHITFIFPTIDSPFPSTLALLKSLAPNINFTFLSPINNQDLPKDGVARTQLAMSKSMSSFRNALQIISSTTPIVALIIDPFANKAIEVAKEFNLLSYVYCPFSAMALSLLLHFPKLNEQVSCDFKDLKEAIQIPGCIQIHSFDLPDDLQDRSSLAYELSVEASKRLSLADGFLVNSFKEIEGGTMKALQDGEKPFYFVGQIIQSRESNGSECVRWLEKQKPKSVLYVAFGSEGTLYQEQLNELALGLELSGENFLWVVRAPSDSLDANDDPLKFLPNGFLDRTKGQGLVVSSWAPQAQILSHGSIGGFLTHCGWNSMLESIVLGVPMIAWPLYADQGLYAVMLTEGLKVALNLRPKFNANDLVKRHNIAKVIKCVMLGEEGGEIRRRVEDLKNALADALKEDGSSARALFEFGSRMENYVRQPVENLPLESKLFELEL